MATSKQYSYYIDGRRLAILEKNADTGRWNAPNSSVSAAIKLDYSVAPDDPIDETSNIDVPNYLALALVDYVMAKVFEESGDLQRTEYYMKNFKGKVGKYASSRVSGIRAVIPTGTAIR